MKLSHILSEASYPGNIGAMEVFQFYRTASPEEKQEFDQYLDQNDYDHAWELIQDVTGVELHPMGESIDERIATAYSDPIESITISRAGHEMTFFVENAKKVDDGWYFYVHTDDGPQKWHYHETTRKIHHNHGERENHVRYIGELVGIDRDERSAA